MMIEIIICLDLNNHKNIITQNNTIIYTKTTVKVFVKGKCIASHISLKEF